MIVMPGEEGFQTKGRRVRFIPVGLIQADRDGL
jgi:hypothetical protein